MLCEGETARGGGWAESSASGLSPVPSWAIRTGGACVSQAEFPWEDVTRDSPRSARTAAGQSVNPGAGSRASLRTLSPEAVGNGSSWGLASLRRSLFYSVGKALRLMNGALRFLGSGWAV